MREPILTMFLIPGCPFSDRVDILRGPEGLHSTAAA